MKFSYTKYLTYTSLTSAFVTLFFCLNFHLIFCQCTSFFNPIVFEYSKVDHGYLILVCFLLYTIVAFVPYTHYILLDSIVFYYILLNFT